MLQRDHFEQIGSLGRTHGINGELSAKLSVDLGGLWEEGARLFLFVEEQALLIPYRVTKFRAKTDEIDLITFAGITSKEAAEALVGSKIWLERDYLEGEDVEEYLGLNYYEGFELYDASSRKHLGRITAIDDSTLNVLMRLETSTGQELVLPIAEELIREVALSERKLYLAIPEGLLDLS